MTHSLMIQGTASNVGKSLIVAGLGRILTRRGYKVAPFKAQNMSLNAGVCGEGLEMGRAQILQAFSCGCRPDTRMNPVLLKPDGEGRSEVVLNGQSQGSFGVREYHAERERWMVRVLSSFHSLAKEVDVVLLEGAGSIAEINLRDVDIVNMALAKKIGCPTLLIGNIDPGGVYGALVGCLELLEPEERSLIRGLVVNRFRGDESLLEPAHRMVSERTGQPFLGVVPHLEELNLPEEDSVSFFEPDWGNGRSQADLDIVVLDYGFVSNINDLEPLGMEGDVRLRKVSQRDELGAPDVVILPGSRNVFHSLKRLRDKGLDEAIKLLGKQTHIFGICGGMMLMGEKMVDHEGIESDGGGEVEGLGLLPLSTKLDKDKVLRELQGDWNGLGEWRGYEMHHGRILNESAKPLAVVDKIGAVAYGDADGGERRVQGTWVHGLFDHDEFRRSWLNQIRKSKGLKDWPSPRNWSLESSLDRWADHLDEHLEIPAIMKLMGLD